MKNLIQKLLKQQIELNGRRELSRIAYESNLSQSMIEKLANGTYKHDLALESIKGLAKALNVKFTDLIEVDSDQVA